MACSSVRLHRKIETEMNATACYINFIGERTNEIDYSAMYVQDLVGNKWCHTFVYVCSYTMVTCTVHVLFGSNVLIRLLPNTHTSRDILYLTQSA